MALISYVMCNGSFNYQALIPVVDPGFPRVGVSIPEGGGANLLVGQKFPENRIKMKEIRPNGRHYIMSLAPPWIRQWILQCSIQVVVDYQTVYYLN